MNLRQMTDVEKRSAAKAFVKTWIGRGDEKQDAQNFWRELLQSIYGVEKPESDVLFEYRVKNDQTGSTIFIDAYIKDTAVLIEQKGMDIDLGKSYKQSDGSMLTPFQQARRYAGLLPHSMNPRWIVVCNFQEFRIHDMNNPNAEPYVVLLKDLEKEYTRLNFLVDTGSENLKREMEISKKAGDLVGLLYNAFLKQYKNPSDQRTLHSLNVLCVRLVFCLYAEDSGIFGKRLMFHDYMKAHGLGHARQALIDLFKVLDQQPEERDPYLEDDLAAFPYVNGGLFADEDIEIPRLNEEIYSLLLREVGDNFNWSEISPTIFGAMFESTLNPETRRKGGMHYTSIENIHKVIDPLFLDDLRAELDAIIAEPVQRTRNRKLDAFHDKLASLEFLDPAAGSGNFLTESYLSLRRLENRVILEQTGGQIMIGAAINPIKVSITQFHGIEINDFAVTVARTALWIAESQMMKETEDIVHMQLDFLPLKTQANIVEGNALRLDWESVVDKSRLSYIMGNPPFTGARKMEQGSEQKKDVQDTFGNIRDVQDLDYVTCWYKKAAACIQGTAIEACFVSTNSICQGSQVPILWNVLFNDYHVHINYAYQTFRWNSESSDEAAVHCVIVCFATFNRPQKKIFPPDAEPITVTNVSPYLIDGDDSFVVAAKDSLCGMPKMNFGNQPRDGGYFVISPEERLELLSKEPGLEKWLHPYIGADEFIKGKERYCLWLVHASPMDISKSKILKEKVEAVRKFRLASKAKTTNGYAKVPNCFAQMTQPEGVDYLIVPRVSSENRKYVPIGFMSPNDISSDAVQIVPNATLYHFGIMTSGVHMAWMRAVCGRLEMRYRYSKEIVYNTFPWPNPTEAQRQKIEHTAQSILDVRAKYPDCPMSVLYSEATMPSELRRAHQQNDVAVLAAYGIKKGDPAYGSESACVAFLMKRYKELTEKAHG